LNKTSTNLPSKPKFHTLTDQDLANATALALKAKKHDLDSAAAAVLKVNLECFNEDSSANVVLVVSGFQISCHEGIL
jgi:hypothetical protein